MRAVTSTTQNAPESDKPSVVVETLGCRLNNYESDALKADFVAHGYRLASPGETADVVVVNSCTVTDQADRKSRNALYRAARSKSPPGNSVPLLIATGCMATGQHDQVAALPGVDYVVDNDRKASIPALVDAHIAGEIAATATLPTGPFAYGNREYSARTRRFLKVQDGCDNHCTFCVIPFVRGRAVSRPLASLLDEARGIIDAGFHEIVITGVNLGRYQHDGTNFATMLEALLSLPGDFRVRLSSLEPDPLLTPVIDLLADKRLCPHLHLCLQSGSDRILLAMRRLYDLHTFEDLLDRALRIRPNLNATTDILVGFPGETDEDFDHTCQAIKNLGFTHCHTFRYAKRDGTRAARIADQVDERVKQRRSAVVRHLASTNREVYLRDLIGVRQRVLVESVIEGKVRGYGENYVPIETPYKETCLSGDFLDVLISGPPLPGSDALTADAFANAAVQDVSFRRATALPT